MTFSRIGFIFLLLFSVSSRAGLLYEPFLGYENSSLKLANYKEFDATGTALGVRVTTPVLSIPVGIQVTYTGLGNELDGSIVDLGIFASFHFWQKYRVYGVYSFYSLLKTSLPVDLSLQGDGSHIGLSYNLGYMFNIDLEYTTRTLRSGKVGQISVSDFEIPYPSLRIAFSKQF